MHGETAEQALMRAATVAGWRAATDDAWGVPACDHHESLWGRCTACGMTWEQQADERTEWGSS